MIQSDNWKMMKKIMSYLGWFLFSYGYAEIYLHIVIYKNYDFMLPVILCLPLAMLSGVLCHAFSRKVNLVLGGIVTLINSLFCATEIIYYGIFHTMLAPFSSLGMAGNAVDFQDVLFKYIEKNAGQIALCFLPVILYFVVVWRKLLGTPIRKNSVKKGCCIAVLTYFLGLFVMLPFGTGIKSPLYTYFYNAQINLNIEKLGVTTGIRLDLQRMLLKMLTGKDSFLYKVDNSQSLIERGDSDTYEANQIAYDFEKLIAEEEKEGIRSIHERISKQEPTYKNEYTGKFKGYNLIFITAEAWWKYAVREDLTPTLWKMLHEGFVFENYYTPLWTGSTIGGEFANLTGLIPKESGQFSMVETGENKNDMRFTLSELLGKEGYNVKAFHSYYHDFYLRHLSHPNMGFEWYAAGNGGYEMELNSDGSMVWPQSDLKLVSDTFEEYGNPESQPFYTNYMSFSGHANYDESNAMAMRHMDKVQDLPYSDSAKAYLACNYELELAVEYLLESLEAKGMLENTLFVIAPDHIPYGYQEMCSELAGKNLENSLEWYQSSLVIWSASMKEPVQVEKYCSSIDVFPTVANLMGLEYDSRMLAGSDILSKAEQFVIFPDRSWITGKGIYNSYREEFQAFDETEEIPDKEAYIDEISQAVEQKIQLSTDIVEQDYYSALPKNVE